MKVLKYFISFGLGAVVGAVTAVYFTKDRIQKEADAQIESVKQTFTSKWNEPDEPEKVEDPSAEIKKEVRTVKNFNAYEKFIRDNDYHDPNTIKLTPETPYIIDPDAYGEMDGYSQVTCYCFSDGVVTDDNYEPLDDLEDTIGENSINHFGIYKDDPDTVYIRNDRIRCDIEILKDKRSYENDIKPKMPRHGDDE